MALKLIEGFEVIPANMLGCKWAVASLTAPVTYTRDHSPNTNALRMVGSELTSFDLGDATTLITGFAFMWSGIPDTTVVFQYMHGPDPQVDLRFNPTTKHFQINCGNTVIGTGTSTVPENTWVYVEFKAVLGDPNGAVVLRVNETVDINIPSVRTTQGASAYNTIRFVAVNAGVWQLDDIYVLDTTGATNNDFLGAMRVEGLAVNHEGDFGQWTVSGSWAMLNWQAVTALDTNRVMTTQLGAQDTYGVSRPRLATTSIAGMMLHVVGRNQDANQRYICPLIRIGNTDYGDHSRPFTTHQSLQLVSKIVEKNPATNTPWVASDFAEIEVGMRLTE